MVTVEWKKALKSITSSKESRGLSWRQGSMFSRPNQRSMARIVMQMVIKKGYNLQSIHIAKTGSQPAKPKVVAFMGIIECKNCPKSVWNSMFKELQMQARKLHEQQGIKPAAW